MALVFHRGLAVPLWAVAFFAIALAAPPRAMPPVTVLLGISVLALTMMAMVQCRRPLRARVAVRPATSWDRGDAGIFMTTLSAGTRVRVVDRATSASAPDDAIDLVRMDDDGAWHMTPESRLSRPLIPGAREPGMLTTFATSGASAGMPDEPSTMDTTTIAERQREGGGAPSQRRPANERWWPDLGRSVHDFVTATRALYTRRFRTNHV